MQKLSYIVSFLFVVCMNFYTLADKDKFPKSKEEKERERIGSIFGDKTIKLSFSKNNNSDISQRTKKEDNKIKEVALQKKCLWQAIIKTLNYAPIAVINPENGIFISEWFSRDEKRNLSQKITILIKNNSLPIDSIEVILQQKIKRKNRWIEKNCQANETDNIRHEIILATKKEIENNK